MHCPPAPSAGAARRAVLHDLPSGVRGNNRGVPVASLYPIVHGRPIRVMRVAVPGSPPRSVTTVWPRRRPVAGRCRTSGPTGATAPLPGQHAPHHTGLTGQLDGRVGLRLKIQPPGRLRVGPAVHRQRDQVRAVLEVPDDDAAGPTCAAARRGQAQCAPAARLGAPQPQAAAGDPVDRSVGRPGETDDDARRKPRITLAVVGRALSSRIRRAKLRSVAAVLAVPGRDAAYRVTASARRG